MTHKDIYTKFMIEYDKANVTSSYPSLTEYEVATVLDKAYHALIAQKVTGNNVRRVGLEGDLKSVTDLAPLINQASENLTLSDTDNIANCSLPEDYLYFISGKLSYTIPNKIISLGGRRPVLISELPTPTKHYTGGGNFYEGTSLNEVYVQPTSGGKKELLYVYPQIKKFCYAFFDDYDSGWQLRGEWQVGTLDEIAQKLSTVEYLTNTVTHIAIIPGEDKYDTSAVKPGDLQIANVEDITAPYDSISTRPLPIKLVNHEIADKFVISAYNMPWIKIPVCYIENDDLFIVYDSINHPNPDKADIIYIKQPNKFAKNLDEIPFSAHKHEISWFKVNDAEQEAIRNKYKFECNDTMAEELISLAVAFALENVESQRLNAKLNMRGLEA